MISDYMPLKPLKSLTENIFSGAPLYSTTSLIEGQDGVPLINIKNIAKGYIETESLQLYPWNELKNAERYFVYPQDVLITCRGTQLKIAVVPESLKKALITANIIAVRLRSEILPVFLSTYLKTPEGQKALFSHVASSTMQLLLNVSDIEELFVPVPPLSMQEEIVNLAQISDEQYRLNIETANLRRKITNQIVIDILAHKEVQSGKIN